MIHCDIVTWHYLSLADNLLKIEPQHNKTSKMTCGLREDSDQPGYPPSLIRVFSVCSGKLRTQGFFLQTAKTLFRLGWCPGWSDCLLGAQVILLVLSYHSSNIIWNQVCTEMHKTLSVEQIRRVFDYNSRIIVCGGVHCFHIVRLCVRLWYFVFFLIQATPAMSTSRISILPLMSKWFFIPNIFSLYFFVFQLRLYGKRLTRSNGYLEVIFMP